MTVTFAAIIAAAEALKGQIVRTPTFAAPALSALTGAAICVKYENMQATGSFKDRGAFIKLSALTAPERQRGVIAMSAGNHAQAVAYHARRLAIPATIVMPVTTPYVKVAKTRSHGAAVVLFGETLAESQVKAEELIAAQDLVLVHPYDDPFVIAGQGTIALEMLADAPDIDVLLVPVGGGGMISGMALAAKAIKPGIEVIGVEAALYPSFWNALGRASLPLGGPTLAEGIAVKNVGRITLEMVRAHVDDIILVGESDLERAVNAFATHQRVMAEGAGAAGLAAVLADPARFAGRHVGIVLCGGNIDARLLASIMVREQEREGRITHLRITAPDRPGLLGVISTELGVLGANILEVSHRRLMLDVPAKGITIDVSIETRGPEHADAVLAALAAKGLTPRRMKAGDVEPIAH